MTPEDAIHGYRLRHSSEREVEAMKCIEPGRDFPRLRMGGQQSLRCRDHTLPQLEAIQQARREAEAKEDAPDG